MYNIIWWVLLKLNVRGKWAGDWFMRWHRKEVQKIIDRMDLDTGDIIILTFKK
jgi:hypothetical protein